MRRISGAICGCLILLGFIVWFSQWSSDQDSSESANEVDSGAGPSRASDRGVVRNARGFDDELRGRVKEVYRQYPILAFDEDVLSKRSKGEFEVFLESLDTEFDVPANLRKMMGKRGVWDSSEVQRFLSDHSDLVDELMGLTRMKTQKGSLSVDYFERLSWTLNRSRKVGLLLRLKMRLHEHLADEAQWMETRDAFHALARHSNEQMPTNVGGMIATSMERDFFEESLRRDVPPMDSSLNYRTMASDTFRGEFVLVMSMLDQVHRSQQGGDEVEGFPELTPEQRRFLGQPLRRELEFTIGEVFAEVVDRIERSEEVGKVPSYRDAIGILDRVLSRSELQDLQVARDALGSGMMVVEALTICHLNRDEFRAMRALKLASRDGFEVTQLEELIPEYLAEVPVNRETQEPFYLDDQNGELEIPTDIRDWTLRSRRQEEVAPEVGRHFRELLDELGPHITPDSK